jgi:flap endonuclease-1
MGINLRELVVSREIGLKDLCGKTLVVDSHNLLYQFLTTIRQADGTPLLDSSGNPTSHLAGMYSRLSNLMLKGIRLAFVFDGSPPKLKRKEIERRIAHKESAVKAYEKAKDDEDTTGMKKFASRTVRLTPQIIAEAKELALSFGCPVIQAPSEGEAQAAHIVIKEKAYGVVSQDFDSLLYRTPNLVRNLSVTGRRKRGVGTVSVSPEIISLKDTLANLEIDDDQLIALSMLVGTDYNIGGIKGIGPKKALTLVRKHDHGFEALFKEAGWEDGWQEVMELFKSMPVTDDYRLEWGKVDRTRIMRLLCDEHDFSRERVEAALSGFEQEQRGLGEFFR